MMGLAAALAVAGEVHLAARHVEVVASADRFLEGVHDLALELHHLAAAQADQVIVLAR
jgi:hypothetical protein